MRKKRGCEQTQSKELERVRQSRSEDERERRRQRRRGRVLARVGSALLLVAALFFAGALAADRAVLVVFGAIPERCFVYQIWS